MENSQKILRFILRLLCLPFMMVISLVSVLYKWLMFNILYVVNGGEIIAYNKYMNRKQILDIYDILVKKFGEEVDKKENK